MIIYLSATAEVGPKCSGNHRQGPRDLTLPFFLWFLLEEWTINFGSSRGNKTNWEWLCNSKRLDMKNLQMWRWPKIACSWKAYAGWGGDQEKGELRKRGKTPWPLMPYQAGPCLLWPLPLPLSTLLASHSVVWWPLVHWIPASCQGIQLLAEDPEAQLFLLTLVWDMPASALESNDWSQSAPQDPGPWSPTLSCGIHHLPSKHCWLRHRVTWLPWLSLTTLQPK